jgi:transcriptional regulator with XRE-family HTH domain
MARSAVARRLTAPYGGMAQRLWDLRRSLGITQREAADAIGMTLRDLRRFESGRASPEAETRAKLAALLKTTVESLFEDVPEPPVEMPKRTRRGSGPGAFNPVDVHVGNRVFLRRTELGISQERLAEALGVSFQQVQKYERGANRISASRLYDLSRVLGVDMNFFFAEMPDDVAAASPGQMVSGWHEEGARYEPDRTQTKEAGELLGAYQRIDDLELRKSLIDLAKAMAERNKG